MATTSLHSQLQTKISSRFASGLAMVWYIAISLLLLHWLTANRYGYFGDAMYHMACGEHLDWGYMDQPPLIAVFAWLTRHLFGTSLFAIHLLPALAGFMLVWLTGLITRELGGGRFAQALVTCAVLLMSTTCQTVSDVRDRLAQP